MVLFGLVVYQYMHPSLPPSVCPFVHPCIHTYVHDPRVLSRQQSQRIEPVGCTLLVTVVVLEGCDGHLDRNMLGVARIGPVGVTASHIEHGNSN